MSNSEKASGPVICHITTVHLPFDTRIFHKECLSLVDAGYEVHLIQVCDRSEVVEGVHVHALPKPPGRLARMFRWTWMAYREVLSICPRPAICHFHDPELLPMGMALRLRGFKVIYDVHENVAGQILSKPYLPKPLRHLVSLLYRFLEGVMTSGMTTVHVLESIARHYRRGRVVVRNLPKLKVASTGKPLPTRRRPVLIYVGAISEARGALRMIRIAAELRRRGLNFELRLVGHVQGDGLGREMRRMIDESNLAETITLVGKVSFEQAQEEIASADVGLCLLDHTPNYLNSLPIKVFEYMRGGVPVVASDIPSWREYVTDTEAGIQVDVTDIEEIANRIEELLGDTERMRRIGQNGRQAVENRYNWEKESQKLLAFYEKLPTHHRSNPHVGQRN